MNDEKQNGPSTRAVERALGELRAPERIGPYTILSVLGEGGMGTVYLAEESDPARRVALKVIKPGLDSREVLRRFRYEQRTLARMNHDAIAKVFHVGVTADQHPYFAMEWVDGAPLDAYCDSWQLGLRARIELVQSICAGVQHAHDRGAVHRDLKPANVLVSRQGDEDHPKVIDFGVARALEVDEGATVTTCGQIVGTPEYMAPEQVDGALDAGIGVHTDIYALGVMLYELVCGAPPFPRLRQLPIAEQLRVIAEETPPSVATRVTADLLQRARALQVPSHALRRAARHELGWIVAKAMHKDPTHRYRGASELAQDLQRFLERRAVAAGPDRASYRVARFLRRHRLESIAASLVAASVVVGVVGVAVGADEARASNATALMSNAQLAQERGDWTQALAALDAAAATGRVDPVDVAVGRVLAHTGAFDDREATDALRWLEQQPIPPERQARVLLLRGLFANRAHDPDAGLDLVRRALERGDLRPSERNLGEYLLAETFDEARAAIERAVASDPHDRLANLANTSLLFCGGYVDEAVAFGRRLEALYPGDPIRAVPRLLEGVVAGRRDAAEAAGRMLPGDDAGFDDAVRGFVRSADVLAGLDDQLVRFVFDLDEFGTLESLQLTAQSVAVAQALAAFYSAAAGDARHRMVQTLGSVVPPCWSRGFAELPRLLKLALSSSMTEPTAEDDALIRDVVRKAADRTGLALFRFMSGYLHAMVGDHDAAIVEYERARRSGALVPVPRSIDRGLLASHHRLWRDGDAGQRDDHREEALRALARLLPHARRDVAFAWFLHVAAELDAAALALSVVETWCERKDGDGRMPATVRAALEQEIARHEGASIAGHLAAALR